MPDQRGEAMPAGSAPSATDWADALLTSGTEALLGAVRNYLGPVKTPYDKRNLVRRLETFLRRPESRASMLALLDELDAKILGTSLLVGPAQEQALKDLFLGELPLFELGIRLSNLLDRLLLFRYVREGRRLVAVNPLIAEELAVRVMDPIILFGSASRAGASGGTQDAPCDAAAIVGFFSFLFHSPSSLRKGGGLTKRAAERAQSLFIPAQAGTSSGGRLDAMARALAASGALRPEDESWVPDRAAFASLVNDWGEDLPFLLAALLSLEESAGVPGRDAEDEFGERVSSERGAMRAISLATPLALLLREALAALPEGFVFSRPGLARWLRATGMRSAARIDALGDPARLVPALELLGLAVSTGDGLVFASRAGGSAAAGPVLVAEGDHAFHLLPEAGLSDRLLVGSLARPVSLGRVWTFELDRSTARAAFASGLGAKSARARLESLAGRPLPQSLAFSLGAWEEEYRSLRLYRGLILVADERQRPVVETGIEKGFLEAEKLGPGIYFLSATGPGEAAAQLARAGLEAPPEATAVEAPGAAGPRDAHRHALGDFIIAGAPRPAPWPDIFAAPAAGGAAAEPLDPRPRIACLKEALASSGRPVDEAKELADRIERRLVLTPEQIAHSDPRPERLEAAGLDYLGKVRVVERALRSPGDRLEVLYRLPGADPVRALLRPVRLDKNDKGLVLEAEDLGTGGPARVPLGAVSTVRRVRASLFGEEA